MPWEDPGEGLPGGGAPLFKPEPVSSSRGQPHETISGGGWSGHEKDLSARFGEETNYQPEVVAGWGWGTASLGPFLSNWASERGFQASLG